MEVNDRLVPITGDLVRALHRVVAEHQVTEAELHQALRFLAELGRADEWVLLSDVLGISVAVDGNSHRQEGQETPSNVQGPYYRPGAPLVSPPVVLCRDDEPGDVCFVAGRVLAAGDRRPLPGALLDVWQANQAGLYDHEDPSQPDWNLRRRFHAGRDGGYEFRTIVPAPYEIPKHGPVGRFLAAVGRHPWRPGHFHLKVTADGFQPLTTMIYFEGDPWLHDDTISSVKPGLVVRLAKRDQPEELRARGLDRPFYTAAFDFALLPR
ncbi:MAG TPA: dioxygenase [Actinomycetota bacterium]|nr:dioxygenase [Actinomycetota bacterium]